MNYNENLSQSDKDDIIQEFSARAEAILKQLENDLEEKGNVI